MALFKCKRKVNKSFQIINNYIEYLFGHKSLILQDAIIEGINICNL